MFVKAKRENDDERGERQGLSVLEELYGITRIRDTLEPDGLDRWLKRLIGVADKLNEQRFRKLYEIEVASRFRFRLPHLEYLCGIVNEEDFFLTAATAAGFSYRGDEMEQAWEDRNAAHSLDWFRHLFPPRNPNLEELTSPAGKPQEEFGRDMVNLSPKAESAPASPGSGFEIHEEKVITVLCPSCASLQMLEMQGVIEATHIPPDPGGERRTEVAESVSRVTCVCSSCSYQFFLFVKHLGERGYAIEPSASMRFRDPHERVEAVDLRFDQDKMEWQKLVGDKIEGPLIIRGSRKK